VPAWFDGIESMIGALFLAALAGAALHDHTAWQSIAKSVDRLPRCGSSPWWLGKAFPRDASGRVTPRQLVVRIDTVTAKRSPSRLIGYLYVTGDGAAYFGAPAPSSISDSSVPAIVRAYHDLGSPLSSRSLTETIREGGPPPNQRVRNLREVRAAYGVRTCVAADAR
jgi:hypothetical protein